MSTEIQATLERAWEVRPVPDSDNLDTITVGGFPVVVRRGSIAEGDFVTYFPPDLELSPFLSNSLGIIDLLKKFRVVKAVKLRGQYSYGVALPLDTPGFERLMRFLEQEYWSFNQTGEGVSLDWYFGTKRYIPVLNESTKASMGREIMSHPLLFKYTDIQHWDKYRLALNDGERVVITEKLHGTNCRVACINGEVMVGSHNTQRALPDTPEEASKNFYWYPLSIGNVERMLTDLGKLYNQVILFGETYGKGVQGGFTYDKDGLAFAAFDLLLNGVYVGYDTFKRYVDQYQIPSVPVDFVGTYSAENINIFRDAPSWLTRNHIREGIVIKPTEERVQGQLGRVILKALNPEYAVKKSAGKVEDNPIV